MLTKATQNSKFRKFARLLRPKLTDMLVDVETVCVGLLERLWHMTASEAPRGNIGKIDDDDIAEMIGWYGPSTELIDILVDARWLDRHPDHRLLVHDWHDHAPNYVKGNMVKAIKRGKEGFCTGEPEDSPNDVPKEHPKERPKGASSGEHPQATIPPNQTKPDLTQPSLTQPHQTGNEPKGLSGLSLNFEFDWEDVRSEGQKFSHKIQFVTPERFPRERMLVVIGFGLVFGNGFATTMADRIRATSGEEYVSKPVAFVNSCMRKQCEERGLLLANIETRIRERMKEIEPK